MNRTLKIVFLTLFLDLVGFSIIFPLFPALAQYYLDVDGDNFLLRGIWWLVEKLMNDGGGQVATPIVLFGGILGALYSFLQFLFAPIWGTLSDKYGRRPILIISVSGLALSYVLWIFSSSFTVLIIARIIGGIMGGNISTATAVVADVTSVKDRSKGMATIGIAFALGFIIGPSMGGLLSLVDLSKYTTLAGINPFSMTALVAFVLSLINLLLLITRFAETHPPALRGKALTQRSANILGLFAPLPFKGVNLVNWGHFLFLTIFSGIEFTLTFLAVERLAFRSLDNGLMFIFIGVILAGVQGGLVRRYASRVGERKMALLGLFAIFPGTIIIGFAHNPVVFYGGLFFLAVGAAMIIPCLTSLVTIYTPSEHQGKTIGRFRSLGALARVFGPLVASLSYWKFGSAAPYFYGAGFLILPVIMIFNLPEPTSSDNLSTS